MWYSVKFLLRATNRKGKMLYEESIRLVQAESTAEIVSKASRLGERLLLEANEDKSFRIVTEGEDEEAPDLALPRPGEDTGVDEERGSVGGEAPPEAESDSGGEDLLPYPQKQDGTLALWDGFIILDIYQTDLEDSELEDGTEVYSAIWQTEQAEQLAEMYEEQSEPE